MKYLITTIAAVVLLGCKPSITIHWAASTGNIEAVKQHLAAGTDVNPRLDDGSILLHLAVTYGYKEIVKLLITNGANVNAMRDNGKTPLDEAIYQEINNRGLKTNHSEIADLLRKNGGKTGKNHYRLKI